MERWRRNRLMGRPANVSRWPEWRWCPERHQTDGTPIASGANSGNRSNGTSAGLVAHVPFQCRRLDRPHVPTKISCCSYRIGSSLQISILPSHEVIRFIWIEAQTKRMFDFLFSRSLPKIALSRKTVDIAPRSVDSPNCPTVIRRIVTLMTTCRATPAQSEDSSS